MTWDFFVRQMDRMRGLKFAPPTPQSHWEALREMPDLLFEAAVSKALPDSEEFPSPKMLKVYADQVRARVFPVADEEDRSSENPNPVIATLPTGKEIPLTRFWTYYCQRCNDLGWESFWCGEDAPGRQSWLETRACGRHREHAPHGWSQPCPCASSNPDVLRRKEREAQTPARGQAS
jgi:hypothetical protein